MSLDRRETKLNRSLRFNPSYSRLNDSQRRIDVKSSISRGSSKSLNSKLSADGLINRLNHRRDSFDNVALSLNRIEMKITNCNTLILTV